MPFVWWALPRAHKYINDMYSISVVNYVCRCMYVRFFKRLLIKNYVHLTLYIEQTICFFFILSEMNSFFSFLLVNSPLFQSELSRGLFIWSFITDDSRLVSRIRRDDLTSLTELRMFTTKTKGDIAITQPFYLISRNLCLENHEHEDSDSRVKGTTVTGHDFYSYF